MTIEFEHAIEIACPPERVFAMLDDVSLAPRWISSCTAMEKSTPGPNEVGSLLRFTYQETTHSGVMEGETTARVPNERLAFRYADNLMQVAADFRLSPTPTGTRLIHKIELTPQTFFVRMLSSLIGSRLRPQTIAGLERLRAILEAENR